MFHECSTLGSAFHFGTHTRGRGRRGAYADAGIGVVPLSLAKDSFWEAYAPKQCALMQATGSP